MAMQRQVKLDLGEKALKKSIDNHKAARAKMNASFERHDKLAGTPTADKRKQMRTYGAK